MILLNILKLLVLVPLLWFFCMIVGGHLWWVWMIGALTLGYFWFKAEQEQKQKKADLEQQVVITRQNMIQAQAEAERAQRKADIEDAVQQGMKRLERKPAWEQWN
jgi:hypothetical protein